MRDSVSQMHMLTCCLVHFAFDAILFDLAETISHLLAKDEFVQVNFFVYMSLISIMYCIVLPCIPTKQTHQLFYSSYEFSESIKLTTIMVKI